MKVESAAIRNMMFTFGIPIEQAGEIVKQSKIVLRAVRSMYWRTITAAEIMQMEASGEMSVGIGAALLYLSDLAPLKERQDYEQRIMRMFENQSILSVIEKTIEVIRSYPDNGELYHTILQNYYVTEPKCSDEAIFTKLHLERTGYYQRKREATLLFGLQIKACGLVAATGKNGRTARKKTA